ncbi:hypothetical protein DFH29DRAFT_946726 [Suillus ampliporus]|nr:hypothetical protein DFH29DRAFT_946726 [Suillus ampliporus]
MQQQGSHWVNPCGGTLLRFRQSRSRRMALASRLIQVIRQRGCRMQRKPILNPIIHGHQRRDCWYDPPQCHSSPYKVVISEAGPLAPPLTPSVFSSNEYHITILSIGVASLTYFVCSSHIFMYSFSFTTINRQLTSQTWFVEDYLSLIFQVRSIHTHAQQQTKGYHCLRNHANKYRISVHNLMHH